MKKFLNYVNQGEAESTADPLQYLNTQFNTSQCDLELQCLQIPFMNETAEELRTQADRLDNIQAHEVTDLETKKVCVQSFTQLIQFTHASQY